MVEWVRQDCQEENPPDDGDYLYLWEDWVALYCKKRLVSLSNGIPENKRYGEVIIPWLIDGCILWVGDTHVYNLHSR